MSIRPIVLANSCALIAFAPFFGIALPTAAQSGDETFNSIGMKFVQIPRGHFTMGSPADEERRGDDEAPHAVQLTKSFYLGVFEVTQKQFERVMGTNPSFFRPGGPGQAKIKSKEAAVHPVESVTWREAVEFCAKIGDRPEEKSRKFTYRLPTEAEWEYACRAGSTSATHYGDECTSYEAHFNGVAPLGKGRTGPFYRAPWTVGGYRGNAFGLYDMHGNVAEWCADWYAADYYSNSPKTDPPGPGKGTERIVRGGGWASTGWSCRSASRQKLPPDFSSYSVGFRVVLMIGE